jgi:DNA invertase Pin-like site-specific DNA recombinase
LVILFVQLTAVALHHRGHTDFSKAQTATVVGIDQAIETRSPTGRLLFHVLGAIAEFETALRKERQLEGIAHAKAQGVPFGRKHALTSGKRDELRQRRAEGIQIKELMKDYQLSKSAIYRYLSSTRDM